MDDLVLEAEGSDLEPTVEVKDLGPCTKSLTITISAAAVDDRLEAAFRTLANDAALPGFRKGHVPKSILEKRFGDSVRGESRSQLVSDAYTKAIEKEGLEVIGDPEFDEDSLTIEIKAGTPITVTATVEVAPTFDLPDLEGVPVVKPELTITQEHIDSEVTRATYRYGKASDTKGPFEALDRMIGHGEVRLDGSDEIFFDHDQVMAVVPAADDEGRGQFLGLLVEGLDKLLLGKNIGDTIEFETVGPDAHEREELRGAAVKVKYEIRQAERVTPLTLDELIEILALDNEEGLQAQFRSMLEGRRDTEQRAAEREQVHEWLLENISFEAPPKMSESQITRAIEGQRMELATRGLENDEIETHLAEMRTKGESEIRDRLRLFFILGRLGQHFDVQVTESEVNHKINELAQSRGERPEQVRAELAKSNRIRDIAIQIQQHKAVDRIVDTAKVTVMSADDWNTRVDENAAAKRKADKA